MSHFITIAGPQSSGKTTAFNYLQEKYPDWYFVDEINPFTVVDKDHMGGAFVNEDLETKLLEIDLAKVKAVINSYNPIAIIETGILHVVYGEFFINNKLAKEYFEKYNRLYQELNSYIIYIDTRPEVSFQRRKAEYLNRIKKRNINTPKEIQTALIKYQNTIYKLYPIWQKFYKRLKFPSKIINNSYKTQEVFLKEIEKTIQNLLI